MRTFPKIEPQYQDYISTFPWMAPGSAPVYTPCGAAGGNPIGCPEGAAGGPGQDCGYPYGGGFAYGPNAENFDFQDVVVTEWTIGGTEVAGWGQVANHGGGKAALTEECFQQTPLR